MKFNLLPAKSVSHDSHAKGAHHAPHTEDCNSNTPYDGTNPRADGLAIALHPGVIEEGSQFLKGKVMREKDPLFVAFSMLTFYEFTLFIYCKSLYEAQKDCGGVLS